MSRNEAKSSNRRLSAPAGKAPKPAATQRRQSQRPLRAEEVTRYQKRLRSLASQLSLAEERERRRISVAIHDGISQTLALIKMKLGALSQKGKEAGLAGPVGEVSALVDEVLAQTRSLTVELSPPILYELGFEAALEWLAERASKQYGLNVSFKSDRGGSPIPLETAVPLFQAVRELLVNVGKHASATRAAIRLSREGRQIRLTVEDNGVGFDASKAQGNGRAAADGAGFGLFSIRTRLDHLGGRAKIKSSIGHGTVVTLLLPDPGKSASPQKDETHRGMMGPP